MQICHVYQFKDNEIPNHVEMMSFGVLYEIRFPTFSQVD